jgi:hypothetical protein
VFSWESLKVLAPYSPDFPVSIMGLNGIVKPCIVCKGMLPDDETQDMDFEFLNTNKITFSNILFEIPYF